MRGLRRFAIAGVALAGCGWPSTRMQDAGDYQLRARPVVTAAPAFTAGPEYRLTYAPDGSTTTPCHAAPAGIMTAGPAC